MALDLVRVKNVGDTTLEGAYGGVGWLVHPGGELVMETEAAKKDWGDWDTRNLSKTEGHLRFRDREFRRVRGLYGVTPGARIPVVDRNGVPELDENGRPKEVLADTIWRERVPKVEIYSMDGTRFTTVLEDPEGADLPMDGTPSDDKDQAIAAMQSQIDKLLNAVADMQTKSVDLPKDTPESAPRPQPKKAKVSAAQSVSSE